MYRTLYSKSVRNFEQANRKSITAYTMAQPSTPTPSLSPQTSYPQISTFGIAMFIMLTSNHDYSSLKLYLYGWRRGVVVSGVGLINEVNRHRARLVLGWVTVCGRVNHLGM